MYEENEQFCLYIVQWIELSPNHLGVTLDHLDTWNQESFLLVEEATSKISFL